MKIEGMLEILKKFIHDYNEKEVYHGTKLIEENRNNEGSLYMILLDYSYNSRNEFSTRNQAEYDNYKMFIDDLGIPFHCIDVKSDQFDCGGFQMSVMVTSDINELND